MAKPTVTLLARPECHLCDEARAGLEQMHSEGLDFELREIDIDGDDGLLKAHLERIPVIEVDGAEVCHLFLDAEAVRARLGGSLGTVTQ